MDVATLVALLVEMVRDPDGDPVCCVMPSHDGQHVITIRTDDPEKVWETVEATALSMAETRTPEVVD